MKRKQQLIDYRNLSIAELQKSLEKNSFNLMTNLSNNATNKINPKNIKRNIAQLNTIINEKQRSKN